MAQILGVILCCIRDIFLQDQWLRYSGNPSVVHKRARQAAAAQTTRKESPCTARAPGKPQQPKRPERKANAPQERKANTQKKKHTIFTKIEKTCSQNAPQDFEKGNLVDKVVLLLMSAFSPPRGFKTGPPDQQQPRRNQHGWF